MSNREQVTKGFGGCAIACLVIGSVFAAAAFAMAVAVIQTVVILISP